MAQDFQAHRFETKLQAALERVRLVLDATRDAQLAGAAHHQYDDKYLLAECMTNAATASQVNCLSSVLGISTESLGQLTQWSKERAVSLRFSLRETCEFDRKEERELKSARKNVVEGSIGGLVTSLTSSVVTNVTDYWWNYTSTYEIIAFRGVGQESGDSLQLVSRSGREQLKTPSERVPRQAANTTSYEVNISWLLKQLAPQTLLPRFSIDRAHAKCHTPQRNKDIEDACRYFSDFNTWATRVSVSLKSLFRVNPDPAAPLPHDQLDADSLVLIPVLPLLAGGASQGDGDAAAASATVAAAAPADVDASGGESGVQLCLATAHAPLGSAVLGVADTNHFLTEELRGLRERNAALRRDFPGGDGAATAAEALIISTLRHCFQVCSQWTEALGYIEDLLRKQLIAAIGKEVSPADFAEYMRFHNRKLFADGYAPVPFCFPVRRSEHHTPEGTVSIEEQDVHASTGSSIASPIETMVAKAAGRHPMHFPLGASTTVSFHGDRYLHAWLSHQFSMQPIPKVRLVSRARQFSSMIVLVGRITSATSFEPKYAAIVQNKDELSIPLKLSTIPTPKEFKDAIESLSPEQQAFAKAFRSMQLESTLFGILVIQIKPQLEKVLNLPANSLTKEIKLTQDLMQLFIKYQIPSDLLSFDAEGLELVGGASAAERLEAVRSHVAAMQTMIDQAKKEEVEERRQQEAYHNPLVAQAVAETAAAAARAMDDLQCKSELMSSPSRAPRKTSGMGIPGIGALFGGDSAQPERAVRLSAPASRSMTLGKGGGKGPPMPAPPPCPQPQAMTLGKGGGKGPPMPAPPPCPQPQAMGCGGGAPPMPPPPPCPQPQAQQSQQPQRPQQPQQPQALADDPAASPSEPAAKKARDYTQVPKDMDTRFEQFDSDGAVRPTIINLGSAWTKRAQKALLAKLELSVLSSEEQKSEKDAAFDLLDALTKSGALAVEHASLHVVVAATHCFDKTVTETVVQDNANPIEKVERSTLIMASTVHGVAPAALVRDSQQPRVRAASPALFLKDEAASLQAF